MREQSLLVEVSRGLSGRLTQKRAEVGDAMSDVHNSLLRFMRPQRRQD